MCKEHGIRKRKHEYEARILKERLYDNYIIMEKDFIYKIAK